MWYSLRMLLGYNSRRLHEYTEMPTAISTISRTTPGHSEASHVNSWVDHMPPPLHAKAFAILRRLDWCSLEGAKLVVAEEPIVTEELIGAANGGSQCSEGATKTKQR